MVARMTGGEHRIAIIFTGLFFVPGLLLLARVGVTRGVAAAERGSFSDQLPDRTR